MQIPHRLLDKVIRVLCAAAAFLAVAILPPAPVAKGQPLDTLSLQDLSAFSVSAGDWNIAGGVWGLWDSRELLVDAGTGVLVHDGNPEASGQLATLWEHGDLVLEFEYMIAEGSDAAVLLQGRYPVRLGDSWGVRQPRVMHAGGAGTTGTAMPPGSTVSAFADRAPRVNASKAPGLWQHIRIVFEAPRRDNGGADVRPASIVEVVHNGVKVQESLRLAVRRFGTDTGGVTLEDPDEELPHTRLTIRASGAAAFRNIRYRHFEPSEPVTLSDVRYTLFRGEFSSLEELTHAEPASAGPAAGYVWNLFGRTADRIGLQWRGTIHIPRTGEYRFSMRFNWIDEIPYEEDSVPGLGRFVVDGNLVVDHTGDDSTATGSVVLTEGEYPFELSYFKNRRLWRPIVFFRVEGPDLPARYLNAYRTLPEPETSYPLVPLEPSGEPYVLRSFGAVDSAKITNMVSVGDPEGVHYAIDLDTAEMLRAWRGEFVDVGSMWTGRGELQVAEPRGLVITFPRRTHGPKTGGSAGERLIFRGYSLDDKGRPTFRFAGNNGFELLDSYQPDPNGRSLRRRLAINGGSSADTLWIRVADGMDVRELRPGIFGADGRYFVQIFTDGVARLDMDDRGRRELLVSVPLSSRPVEIEYAVIW